MKTLQELHAVIFRNESGYTTWLLSDGRSGSEPNGLKLHKNHPLMQADTIEVI